MAMRLVKRSAVRSLSFSALQPDLRVLKNSSIFPRIGIVQRYGGDAHKDFAGGRSGRLSVVDPRRFRTSGCVAEQCFHRSSPACLNCVLSRGGAPTLSTCLSCRPFVLLSSMGAPT
jgi:hypothetical protein